MHLLEHATSTARTESASTPTPLSGAPREKVNIAATIMIGTAGWRRGFRRGRAARMADRPGPQAGGFILAVAVMAGTIIGGLMGQPSIGLLAGLGIGAIAALAIWLRDRARRGD
jgi:hypothetical protein